MCGSLKVAIRRLWHGSNLVGPPTGGPSAQQILLLQSLISSSWWVDVRSDRITPSSRPTVDIRALGPEVLPKLQLRADIARFALG